MFITTPTTGRTYATYATKDIRMHDYFEKKYVEKVYILQNTYMPCYICHAAVQNT